MVRFSFWEASVVADRILVIAGEYVDIFSDIHSVLSINLVDKCFPLLLHSSIIAKAHNLLKLF